MSTIEKQVVVLESDCVCADEDGPDYGECFGCYDDAKENLKHLINAWVDAQGKEFSEVRIDGTGMGWQRQSGYAHTDIDDLAHALALRGDFRIVFTLENGELTATRSSHDEPTGAHFTFTPQDEMGECDKCGNDYELSSRDGRCGDCGNCSGCCAHK
jgi:hypothetical protein